MHVAQSFNRREFDDDLVQEVGCIAANPRATVNDDPRCWTVPSPHFRISLRKGVLVDLFNEPMTGCIGNAEGTRNDPFGHRRQ